jgi:JmjC domain, hydroxylase
MLRSTVIASEKLTVSNLNNAAWSNSIDWDQPQVISKKWFDSQLLYKPDLFSDRYGENMVSLTDNYGHKIRKHSIASLIERWFTPNASERKKNISDRGLVCHWTITQEAHREICMCRMPSQIQCLLDEFRQEWFPIWDWVILAPEDTCVQVHQDMVLTASWNILTSGRKLWAFWSPESSPPKRDDTKEFFEEILSKKYSSPPNLLLIQEVDDLIWIPSRWWHSVYYLQPCICVTKNIINSNNLKIVLEQSKNDKYLHKLISLIAEHKGLIGT